MSTRKQNKRIAFPWIVEIESSNVNYLRSDRPEDTIVVNLFNELTGEIRQKAVSIDQVGRRIFESEISTWEDIELEDIKEGK
jgi:hypothetical protein